MLTDICTNQLFLLSLPSINGKKSNDMEKRRMGLFWRIVLAASVIVIVAAEVVLVYQLRHDAAAAALCIAVPVMAYCVGALK